MITLKANMADTAAVLEADIQQIQAQIVVMNNSRLEVPESMRTALSKKRAAYCRCFKGYRK